MDFRELLNRTPEEWAKNDEEVKRLEKLAEKELQTERYKKSGVPERYQDVSFENFIADSKQLQSELSATESFVQKIKCGIFSSLVLVGNCGTGKTHLACSALREVGGLYRMAPAIVEEIRNAKSFTAKYTEQELLQKYTNVMLLVVDEIGRGIVASDEKYMLYQIINSRYNAKRATILISNLTKKDFVNYIGEAAADRLTESCHILEFTQESYRTKLRCS